MRTQKRQSILRIAERAALAVAVCDLLLYVFAARPVRARLEGAQQSYSRLRLEMAQQESRVARFEHLKASLPKGKIDLQAFLTDHVPARRWCFSTADQLVRKLTEKAHVQLSSVGPRLVTSKKEPLDHLSLVIAVDGTFSDIVNFTHAVETANDLLLIRNFSFSANQGNTLSLKLGTDLYLTP